MKNRSNITRCFALMTAISIGVGFRSTHAGDDFGSWHALSVKLLDADRWTLSAVGQVRLRDDSTDVFAYFLSVGMTYKASPYLGLVTNYTYLPTKAVREGEFRDEHRLEVEINPRWPIKEELTLDLRNRFEIRWLEGLAGTNERSRHRPQASFRLHGHGALESLFINNEFFYDHDAHRYNQNRLIPLGLTFRASPSAVFSMYYMLWSVKGSETWSHSHVLGTQLSLDF